MRMNVKGYWRQKREEAHWMRKDTEEIERIGAYAWGRIGLDWQARGLGCLLSSPKIEVNNGEGGRDNCDVTTRDLQQICSSSRFSLRCSLFLSILTPSFVV